MTEIALSLSPAQLDVFQSPARFVVLVAGRRFGKSHLAVARTVVKALDEKNVKRKAVWLLAPTQSQAKQIYWNMLIETLQGVIKSINVNEGLINLKNGVQIGVKGADRPDTLRGVGLYDVILDEYASMKPQVWEEIIRPSLSDVKGTALFIGTPAGRNHFYDLCALAAGGEEFPFRGHGALGEEWQAFHYTSLDNPFLPEGEVEAARKTLSTVAFRQEYMASFETGGGTVFNREWLKYADEEPTHADKNGKTVKVPGDWFVTVDLAGFAGITKAVGYMQKRLDRTAICVVKVLEDERWYVRDIYMGRWGIKETAQKIVDACDSVKTMNLGMEKGSLFNAVAPEIVDCAAKKKVSLMPQPLSHQNERKSDRVAWALQGRFEHGKVLIRKAPWNRDFEDEFANFPSKLVHDDSLDSLAFIVQLAEGHVFDRFAEAVDEPYWEPEDATIGF